VRAVACGSGGIAAALGSGLSPAVVATPRIELGLGEDVGRNSVGDDHRGGRGGSG
jgi:hypothetical protein